MTRYIDADDIQFITVPIAPLSKRDHVHYEKVVFKQGIENAPTIDAVPVRHAKWIPKITKIVGIDWPSGMKCSGCGEDALNAEGIDFLTDFCPHCGARMDEDNVE